MSKYFSTDRQLNLTSATFFFYETKAKKKENLFFLEAKICKRILTHTDDRPNQIVAKFIKIIC